MKEENIFQIDKPDEWHCSVERFSNSQNMLRIELQNIERKTQQMYLIFRKVRYFTGWMSWIGANFTAGSDNECYALLNKGILEHKQLDRKVYRFSNLTLFQVHGVQGKHIQIIANAGGLENADGNMISSFPRLMKIL